MERSPELVERILEPIELDDAEIAAVSGGVNQTSTQTVNATQTSTQTANATITNSTFSGGSFSF
jgi:hypothetical protein